MNTARVLVLRGPNGSIFVKLIIFQTKKVDHFLVSIIRFSFFRDGVLLSESENKLIVSYFASKVHAKKFNILRHIECCGADRFHWSVCTLDLFFSSPVWRYSPTPDYDHVRGGGWVDLDLSMWVIEEKYKCSKMVASTNSQIHRVSPTDNAEVAYIFD